MRRQPTLSELAGHPGGAEEEIAEALEAANTGSVLSLDRPTIEGEDWSLPVADTLGSECGEDELVDLLLLPEVIAALLGYSQMQVSRMLARAVRRMRAALLLQ